MVGQQRRVTWTEAGRSEYDEASTDSLDLQRCPVLYGRILTPMRPEQVVQYLFHQFLRMGLLNCAPRAKASTTLQRFRFFASVYVESLFYGVFTPESVDKDYLFLT